MMRFWIGTGYALLVYGCVMVFFRVAMGKSRKYLEDPPEED